MVAEWFNPLCDWLGVSFVGLLLIAVVILLVLIWVRG